MKTPCRMCDIVRHQVDVAFWDAPLLESAHFVVVPSLGALVEGWLLVIPKEHFLSANAMPPPLVEELHELKRDIAAVMGPLYGSVVAFEHGPSRSSCHIGCGVDHAHLHLVPFAGDLGRLAEPLLPKGVAWDAVAAPRGAAAGLKDVDYLYLEQPLGAARIAIGSGFSSQVFRRVIAAHLGRADEFDWRGAPQYDCVLETVERLKRPLATLGGKWTTGKRQAAA